MKIFFLSIVLALIGFNSMSQVSQGSGGPILANSPLSNNVGIGVLSPTHTLHIKDKVGGLRVERNDGSNQTNSLEVSVTSNMVANPTLAPGTINFRSMNQTDGVKPDMSFSANGATHQVTLKNNGNLGIATVVPQEQFQIGDRFTFHDGGTKYIGYNSRWDGSTGQDVRLVTAGASQVRFEQGNIRFVTASNAAAGVVVDGLASSAMTITTEGRVGIGPLPKMVSLSNPNSGQGVSARLHVICSPASDGNTHHAFGVRFERLPQGGGRQMVVDNFGYVRRRPFYAWFAPIMKAKNITEDSDSIESDEINYLYEEIQQLKKEVDILKRKAK